MCREELKDMPINTFLHELVHWYRDGGKQYFPNWLEASGEFRRGHKTVAYAVLAPLVALADEESIAEAYHDGLVMPHPKIENTIHLAYVLIQKGCGISLEDVSESPSSIADYFGITDINGIRMVLREEIPDGDVILADALMVLLRFVKVHAKTGDHVNHDHYFCTYAAAVRAMFGICLPPDEKP